MSKPLRLLFVCVENSNRSQMAEAFARMHGGENVESHSAGSRPSGKVNPKAVEAMRERNYDLTTHTSVSVDDLPGGQFDAVVGMGCGDACPYVPATHHLEWDIPDPRDMTPEEFRGVRDLIESKVQALIVELSEAVK